LPRVCLNHLRKMGSLLSCLRGPLIFFKCPRSTLLLSWGTRYLAFGHHLFSWLFGTCAEMFCVIRCRCQYEKMSLFCCMCRVWCLWCQKTEMVNVFTMLLPRCGHFDSCARKVGMVFRHGRSTSPTILL
jgi:hypothetical protein